MTKKSNTAEFIEKAKIVHIDKDYDYSLVNYINGYTKVEIICLKNNHGLFTQMPNNHLKKVNPQGCPKCGIIKRSNKRISNTDEFIKKAKIVHFNNNYDYSEVNYFDAHTKVKIRCPIDNHGIFEQTPNNHLNIQGCPICGNIKISNKHKYNTNDFIIKAKLVHFDKDYDYSKINYVNSLIKVKIGCPVDDHGFFEQSPADHLQYYGCPKCGDNIKSNTIEFIKKSKLIHGIDRYDYKLAEYVNNHTKVKLICPIDNHGIFEQSPNSHLLGHGCSLCLYKNEAETRRCLNLLFPNIEICWQYHPYLNKRYEVDFYFIYKNKAYIVEYNGLQHYEISLFFYKTQEKAEIALIKQQNRNQYGRDQCKENNITLIEIDCREVSFDQIYTYLQKTFKDVLVEVA